MHQILLWHKLYHYNNYRSINLNFKKISFLVSMVSPEVASAAAKKALEILSNKSDNDSFQKNVKNEVYSNMNGNTTKFTFCYFILNRYKQKGFSKCCSFFIISSISKSQNNGHKNRKRYSEVSFNGNE